MNMLALIIVGASAGIGAGLLAGLCGIGGGVVVVPVIFYGLVLGAQIPPDQAAHIAVATSLAAILPAAVVSSVAHWRAGNTDLEFLCRWGPAIALGVIVAQLAAPHLRGSLMSGTFAVLCLVFAARFVFPTRFKPLTANPPDGALRNIAGAGIGLCSGLAGVGGGIMTNIVMSLSGVPMHKSIGRAAAVGVVVSIPATLIAALTPESPGAMQLGSINLAIWACIAPSQAVAAWFGARLAQQVTGPGLSRVLGLALAVTGAAMLRSTGLCP